MKKISLVSLGLSLATACLATLLLAAQAPQAAPIGAGQTAAQPSAQLLDRGGATNRGGPGGGVPTTIALPGAGPGAFPAPTGFGAPGALAFPPGAGGFLGNLFLPGTPAGYPAAFLTSGAIAGFDVTGAFAWHLAPTPAASMVRILGAAAVPLPTPMATPFAPVGPIVAGVSAPVPPTGTPALSGMLFAPGLFGATPLRVTPTVASGLFCGLAVGAPGFAPIGAGSAGNGLGGVSGVAAPPLRAGPFPLVPGPTPLLAFPAPPAAYIAGCFADSSTTPVELMTFSVE